MKTPRFSHRNRFRLAIFLLALSRVLLCAPEAQADSPANSLTAFQDRIISQIQKVEPSLVAVAVFLGTRDNPLPADEILLQRPIGDTFSDEILPSRMGMGVVLKHDDSVSYVLSSAFLVEPTLRRQSVSVESRILILSLDGTQSLASLYASDPISNLCILKVEWKSGPPPVLPVQLTERDQIRKGLLTFSLDDPWSLARHGSPRASIGSVANRQEFSRISIPDPDRDLLLQSLFPSIELSLQFDENSGAAVCDLDGKLIGWCPPIRDRGTATSRQIALPFLRAIRKILSTLLEGREVEYGELPFSVATLVNTNPSRTGTVVVTGVFESSTAEVPDIRPGDEIMQLNEHNISSHQKLLQTIAFSPPGSTVELKVRRPSTQAVESKQIRIGKWAVINGEQVFASNSRGIDRLGLQVDFAQLPWHPETGKPNGKSPAGVHVRTVEKESPAERAGVKVGMYLVKVGEQPVETPDEYQEALKYWSGRIPITLGDGREVTLETAP